MKPHLLLITFGLIILFSRNLYSQNNSHPCYIINHLSDTSYGTGYVGRNPVFCMFKRTGTQDFIKFYPDEIKAFRTINGKYYVSKRVEGITGKPRWYFLEFLVEGKLDLFVIGNSDRFFIQKDNDSLLELNDEAAKLKKIDGLEYKIKDNRYVGVIKYYMADAPQLFPEIDHIEKLQQKDLVKLSMDYHKAVCNEYECVNYAKSIAKVQYKFEALSGANYHNAYYTPQYGGLVHISQPLRNERLFFKTGLLYSARSYARKDFRNGTRYNLKIPASFEYVFGKRAFKPTLDFGCPTGIYPIISLQTGFIYSISQKVELSFSGSVDGIISLFMDMHPDIFNNNLGHSINFGLIYAVR